MPLQQTSGNVTTDAYGGGVAAVPNYIEDVFSTYLYTGNGSTQTITNGIDLAGKGGLVWIKPRNQTGTDHWLQTSNLGYTNSLKTNSTSQLVSGINIVSSVSATGFTDAAAWPSGWDIVSWTLKKQPKFFDVVTYTGNTASGSAGTQTISHNLGSVPAVMIVKATSTTDNWFVYHQDLGNTTKLNLNLTTAAGSTVVWGSSTPTSTTFKVGKSGGTTDTLNTSGITYVAYLFAHNAGGFGLTGTDNVISCGSFTTDASGNTTAPVNLGYEPQWVLMKRTNSAQDWFLIDNMRQMSVMDSALLRPNTSGAENLNGAAAAAPTATGFYSNGGLGISSTYIYIAIRRGPMKVPTDGTKVMAPVAYTGDGVLGRNVTTGFATDMVWGRNRTDFPTDTVDVDRLRGDVQLYTDTTGSEASSNAITVTGVQNGFVLNNTGGSGYNQSGQPYIRWAFRRAPGTFDEVCYTGDGVSNRNVPHNLGVAPELVVIKIRSGSVGSWLTTTNFGATTASELYLDSTGAQVGGVPQTYSNLTLGGKPTASNLVFGYPYGLVNTSGYTYVAYLWATNPGVTKVGTYTGNGSTQTINCGFTGGSRFVLIKAANATSGWWVYDTARGMTTLTDPYLQLNSTAAETATLGSVTTVTTGFAVNESILAGINTSGTNYVFLSYA